MSTEGILFLLLISCIVLIYENVKLNYKISFYEEILKLNKDKFTKNMWEKIMEFLKK
jgi:hypothetical protein